MNEISRRQFLKASATSAGGLFVGLYAFGSREPLQSATSTQLTAFVEIEPQGIVNIFAGRPEIGQGVLIAIPRMIAEELDVDWQRVRIRQPSILAMDEKYGDQFTGGSTSVHESIDPMRQAGAVARALLVAAAAKRWGVAADSCTTNSGQILHQPTGRTLKYEEVAADAAQFPVPKDVPLKDPGQYQLLGKPATRTDVREIVTGQVEYGLDVKIPGMLRAFIERCPVFGGKVKSFNAERTLKVSGVKRVVEIRADDFRLPSGRPIMTSNGVAVIADSTWAAWKGRDLLQVEWTEGEHANESTENLRSRSADLLPKTPADILMNDGNFDTAFASSAKKLEAVYEMPFVEASPLEPMNCTARFENGRCEVWAPAQNPYAVQQFAGAATGLDPKTWMEAVTVHPLRPGGGFGRRLDSDYAAEAAFLAKAIGGTVQVIWTREDEIQHSLYRTMGSHRLQAGLDSNGLPVAWSHHVVNPSRYAYQHSTDSKPYNSEVYPDDFPAHVIPNFRVGYSRIECPVPIGYYRSMVHSSNNFALQSFLDEIAHAGGKDPVALRLELLGKDRDLPYADHGGPAFNTGRLRKVLEAAAEHGNWGKSLPENHGRGIACGFVFGSYVAEVAEVSIEGGKNIRVERMVAAVDPGRIVNPAGVEVQVQGAVIDGLNMALNLEITLERGRVIQSSFADYSYFRIKDIPPIEVYLLPSDATPWGIGEIPVPPAISAVANAVFAATGKRIRRLPIRL